MVSRSKRSRSLLVAAVSAAAGLLIGGVITPVTADRSGPASPADTVHTRSGWLHGVSATGYSEWLGIPYAAPPTGQLRWKAPQPPADWNGVRDATRFGSRCVQGTGWDPGYDTPKLDEDCLYLNVYAPHTTGRGLPVMMWIHGGGFTGGAGQDTDPRKYVEKAGVVYVTINYRLGALGFLDLPQLRAEDETGPGNFGLLDQQAALRWVRDNIAAFGGNPGNVTIAGQSAGGSSVCDQLASPSAHGMFAKAIIMSGGCGMQTQAAADTTGQAYAAALHCTDPATELACLRAKSPAEILAAQQAVRVSPATGGDAWPIDPGQAVAAGQFDRVPVMNGQTHDERRLFVFSGNDNLGHPVTAAQFESTIRASYGANADRVLAAYPVTAYPSPGIALATVQSDAGSYQRALLDARFAKYVPTWAYEFAEEQTPQFASIYLQQQKGDPARSFPFGATHVDDLPYLWEYLGMTLPFTDDELELSDQMIGSWSAFQAAGDPNWPRYGAPGADWMILRACDTPPASDQPPASCAAASTDYITDHKLGLWQSVLG
jgi:para-nitrobenzyl esterase